MPVELKAETKAGVFVVEIVGDAIDASNVQQFKSDVNRLLDGKNNVVFDFSAVKFVDSSGIGALLSVFRTLRDAGHALKFCSLPPSVETLFETVRMTRIVATFDTQELAIASFSA